MDPSFMNHTDENQEMSELHLTSNTFLNSVELLMPWTVDFNTQLLFNSQHCLEDINSLIEDDDDEFVPSLIQPHESANNADIQHNSDGKESTEIFMDPPTTLTFNESLASPDMILTHNIDENTDDLQIIQENPIQDIKSLWEDEIMLHPLSDEPTDLIDCEINSSASLNIDEPIMKPNVAISSPVLVSKKRRATKKKKKV